MIVTLSTERIRTLEDVRAFVEGSGGADITPLDRESAYAFIERTLVRFRYHVGLDRKGKGLVRKFHEAFGYLSGPATKHLLWRQYHVHGDKRFTRLANISNGHIYNLRKCRRMKPSRGRFRRSSSSPSIGQRRRPRPEGRPGFLRVDTVHTGERKGEKRPLYHQHRR